MKWNVLAAAALAALVRCASLEGADVSLAPARGIVLLTNGETIEGAVTAAGDCYDVTLPSGQIRLRRSQVALVARDLQECYRHKQSETRWGRVQDHIALAEWCLRHGLLDEAQREVAAARAADATHPRVAVVENRLQLARDTSKPAVTRKAAAAAPGAAQPVSQPLDLLVRNLPHGSVESFTNQIQPLLLNYCARAGCHTAQSSAAMRLERIPPNRYTGRKSTQRNLQTVLQLIDRERPGESKLLSTPVQPHGAAGVVIFTDRQQSQYKQLVQWVYQVAGAKVPASQPTLEERTAPLLERGPYEDGAAVAELPSDGGLAAGAAERANTGVLDRNPQQRSAEPPSDAPGVEADGTSASPPGNVHPPPRPAAAQGDPPRDAAFVPKDPFDPELFNRRYADRPRR
jgi:hypothetical protein